MTGPAKLDDSPYEVVVIGAGAAGLLAAARAAERGRCTLLLEKNPRAGVKILMSGGARCNLTHATDRRGIVRAFAEQGPFLHSALAALGPSDLVALIEAEGVPTKVEETGKIFPCSNRAGDVLAALLARLGRSGCELATGEPAINVERQEHGFRILTPIRTIECQRLIVTTGGQSYPRSGTSGDGYAWLEAMGHTITPRRPALTPVTTEETWVRSLMGVTVPDVAVRVTSGDDPATVLDARAAARGSLLFTHFGLSGPVVLDVSRAISGHPSPRSLILLCDFWPKEKEAPWTASLRAQCAAAGKKQLISVLEHYAPRRLSEALFAMADIPLEQRAAETSNAQLRRLAQAVKATPIRISGVMGFRKAEVTAGGVSRDEVDSRTMESKLVGGLFLAGEILDLDGPIGGYNFQAAFSTGWLAGDRV